MISSLFERGKRLDGSQIEGVAWFWQPPLSMNDISVSGKMILSHELPRPHRARS